MDKKTFISELKQALSVLQQEELDDIISEYEQHIDMKQANGLTEEDAIADFGSLDELAAEILEAYHVRSDYSSNQEKKKKHPLKKGQTMKDLWKKTGTIAMDRTQKAGKWLWGVLSFFQNILKMPVIWLKERIHRSGYEKNLEEYTENITDMENQDTEKRAERQTEIHPLQEKDTSYRRSRREARVRETFSDKIVRYLTCFSQFCFHGIFWCASIAWNGMCIGFSLICACFGLFCLYSMGLLVVLLLQGYPLAGVTLGCIGLVMCSFSAAWLSITLLCAKSKTKEVEGAEHA